MLRCSKCKIEKGNEHFSKNKRNRTGYNNWCKECHLENRKGKQLLPLQDAQKFLEDLESTGELFTCKSCGEEKTAKHFYFKRDYGTVKLSTSNCRECNSHTARLATYGVTKEQFISMLEEQNHCCAICGISHEQYRKNSNGKRFAVDHCHTKGHVRALLCEWCNKGLGHFKDDYNLLLKAAQYIKDKDIVSTSSES